MREQNEGTRDWAWEEFGQAKLGDARRVSRLVSMASVAAEKPSGVVSAVYRKDAEQQGAYDFLENLSVKAATLVDAAGRSCARRSAEQAFVYVPIDGSSLTIVDHACSKGFGHVGTYTQGLRGLKVITALAVNPAGTPIGIAHLEWWNRQRYGKFASYRPPAKRESQKWRDTIDAILLRFKQEAPELRLWFQLDREGDSKTTLIPLAHSGHAFTVRSRYDRRLEDRGGKRAYLHQRLHSAPVLGEFAIDLPRRGAQPARTAQLRMRSVSSITVATQNKWNRKVVYLQLNVVWVHEVTQGRKKPLDWILLTNQPVATPAQSRKVLQGYCQRWRIEDFHRTWKSGLCNAEQTQLRATQAVQKWATILATVAVRSERLKHLARTCPDQPASIEFTPTELKVLRILKKRQKKRTEVLPRRTPTLEEAVLWIAQLGGYINQKGQGPPGIKTIQRGLDRFLPAVEIIELMGIFKKEMNG
jgi:hypothetical protein